MANKYLTFDGVAGKITVPNNAALNFGTGDFSICFWADFTDMTGAYLSKGIDGDNRYAAFVVKNGSNFDFKAWIIDDAGGGGEEEFKVETSIAASSLTGFHHVAFTIDKSGYWKIYVDAALKQSTDNSPGEEYDGDNTKSLLIQEDAAENLYKASLDDLRIYKKVLEASEIATIYNGGTPKVYTVLDTPTSGPPAAAWNMNEGSGTTITDEIGGLVGTFSPTGVTWADGYGAGTTPILESIALNIKSTIAAVTVANGYNQTLTAIRSRRNDYMDVPPQNNLVLIEQDDRPQEAENQRLGSCDVEQVFYCIAHVLDSDSETDSVDTRRNLVYADMKKALMADLTRGGYAASTRVLPQINIKDPEGGLTGVVAPVVVLYGTALANPYTGF